MAGDNNSGFMQGEAPAFAEDTSLPDHSDDIMSIFGVTADADAGDAGANAGTDGQGAAAPSPDSSSAADGGGEQPQSATPPATTQDTGQAPPSQPQPAQPTPAPAAAPASAPQTPQVDAAAEVQALKAQVQALTQMLQQNQQPQSGQTGQPTGPAVQQPEQPNADQLQEYNIAIPQDVSQAIFSEDPNLAQAGLNHLINSFGKLVHQRVIQHVDQLVSHRLTDYGQQQTLTQQQQEMQRDYFSHFTDHSDPGIRLIVAQEAQQMWSENPQLAWNEESRNSLGARVNARLGRVPVVTQPADPAPAPAVQPMQPAPRPAAQMGASTRPAGGTTADDEGSFIRGILSAG